MHYIWVYEDMGLWYSMVRKQHFGMEDT
jgi:hypothetical protein